MSKPGILWERREIQCFNTMQKSSLFTCSGLLFLSRSDPSLGVAKTFQGYTPNCMSQRMELIEPYFASFVNPALFPDQFN